MGSLNVILNGAQWSEESKESSLRAAKYHAKRRGFYAALRMTLYMGFDMSCPKVYLGKITRPRLPIKAAMGR